MATTSTRRITINFADDLIYEQIFRAADNDNSPGVINVYTLAAGVNTILSPVDFDVRGATIIPPAGNLNAIVLKGIAGDTGISISPTDPTSLGFDVTFPVSFVLDAGDIIEGLRIIWT